MHSLCSKIVSAFNVMNTVCLWSSTITFTSKKKKLLKKNSKERKKKKRRRVYIPFC